MWKDYVSGYIKNNRSSVLAIRLSAFISALLLSLLCGLFYNAWKYEVERIVLQEGGWQARIIGELKQEDIDFIQNFANIKEVREEENKEGEWETNIYFYKYKTVFSDMPRIADQVHVPQEKVVYNYELLAMYLIRGEGDTAPRLIFPMYLLILALASLSLIIIIHNAFGFSMEARIHQFGIFKSIGATPKQVRTCLLQEAAVLCTLPVFLGSLFGIAGSLGLTQVINVLASDVPGRHQSVPGYHPLVFLFTMLITIVTIWICVWIPARKLSRLTPLEAIKNRGELGLKRKRNSPILSRFFGVEGELAGNALKAQGKALRTASLSLIFSFLAFTVMECFFSLSGISTRETYFEKYQNVWDIMVTVRDAKAENFKETEEVQGLAGVKSAVVYQKARAKRVITEEEMSEEMKSFGGFSHASLKDVTPVEGGWLVNVPIVILDDNSFFAYCKEIGAEPGQGAVVLNRIRDVTNPDFRHPDFMPYVKERGVSLLRGAFKEEKTREIPVLSYTGEIPALREEYATLDYYELVHFIPVSLWREIKEEVGGEEDDFYICIRGGEHVTLEGLCELQEKVGRIVGNYTAESENRIQEYETNHTQIQGMMVILGGFCVLLGIIGVGNVFSNTLGFVRQRKREFARYLSIGMTPKELRKMFGIEAMVIALRPVLITLPLAVFAVGCMLKLSYLKAGEFLAEAPLIPIFVFMLGILGTVALAYSFAWGNLKKISLVEVLKDDTMM